MEELVNKMTRNESTRIVGGYVKYVSLREK